MGNDNSNDDDGYAMAFNWCNAAPSSKHQSNLRNSISLSSHYIFNLLGRLRVVSRAWASMRSKSAVSAGDMAGVPLCRRIWTWTIRLCDGKDKAISICFKNSR